MSDAATKPFSAAVDASEGAMRLSVYVVTSFPTNGFGPLEEVLPKHREYLHGLEKRGVLIMAGPLSDEDPGNWSGGGMLAYLAEDEAAARDLADADPMHTSGARTYTLRRWLVNEGSLTVRVKLSDQSAAIIPAETD